jgi:hypothetical protein
MIEEEASEEDSPHQLHPRGEGVGVLKQLRHILEIHSPDGGSERQEGGREKGGGGFSTHQYPQRMVKGAR